MWENEYALDPIYIYICIYIYILCADQSVYMWRNEIPHIHGDYWMYIRVYAYLYIYLHFQETAYMSEMWNVTSVYTNIYSFAGYPIRHLIINCAATAADLDGTA